ncbi:MAG: pyridoxamine 5'-phosphate oxidase family protein [Sporichthyaceae bacterium]
MSGRDKIRMGDAEIAAYLDEQKVIQVATIGPNGRPHLAPLWYVARGNGPEGLPVLGTWTYGKSQKALNLRRLPQATVLVESGDSYAALRGISMECDVELVEDRDGTLEIGLALAARYGTEGYGEDQAATVAVFEAQAAKRVGVLLKATKVATWDHGKIG